jgi:hypothetical protein
MLAVLAATPSHAGAPGTGNDLLESCAVAIQPGGPKSTNPEEMGRANYCVGFVMGMLAVGRWLPQESQFCKPPNVTVVQGAAVFVKFLRANPEVTNLDAPRLAVNAFKQAWPCSN